GQIEMIVAARCRRRACEDRIDEECRRDFLQPQPGMADGAGDDVEGRRRREAEQQYAAQDHQREFEDVERAPLQMTLAVEYELVGEPHCQPTNERDTERPGGLSVQRATT